MRSEFEIRLQDQLNSQQEDIDNFNDEVFMLMEKDYKDCDEFINQMYSEGWQERRFNARNSYNFD